MINEYGKISGEGNRAFDYEPWASIKQAHRRRQNSRRRKEGKQAAQQLLARGSPATAPASS